MKPFRVDNKTPQNMVEVEVNVLREDEEDLQLAKNYVKQHLIVISQRLVRHGAPEIPTMLKPCGT